MKTGTQPMAAENSRARFGGRPTRIVALLACSLLLAAAASAKTIKVTSASDTIFADGLVTLREAITAANTNLPSGDAPKGDPGLDTIIFEIPGPGVHTINLTSPLPAITEALKIDGYTQGVAHANTLPVGNDAVLLIELNGTGAGVTASGLDIDASGCTIKGLVINRFHVYGINVQGGGANVISGNFIGTNAAGTGALPAPNNKEGVYITSDNNTIGGVTPADRNVISGNDTNALSDGIVIGIDTSTGNKILGNYIGTNASGTAAVSNGDNGIVVRGKSNIIGGTTPAERNVISGNSSYGISLFDTAASNQVRGNYIGTKADGVTALGNGIAVSLAGTVTNNIIGGTQAGAGNVIAFSKLVGVEVGASGSLVTNNSILGNAIFSNGTVGNFLGIDLIKGLSYGPTANDDNTGDADVGPNNLQNFPVLTSASVSGASTSIQGTLDSAAGKQFRIELFSNSACDSTGYGEGEKFIGWFNVTTNGSGKASFTAVLPTASLNGYFFAATATDPNGNTSEFSECKQAEAGSFAFSSATYSGSENAGSITITVQRTGASTGAVSVNYQTSPGTATAFDFVATTGTLQFADGMTSQTFNVPIKDDSFYEGNESFTVAIGGPNGGATIGNPSQATVTILEDDPQPAISINDLSVVEGNSGLTPANFTVSLSNASYQQITVNYSTTAGGTATGGSDYQAANGTLTFNPGETSKPVTVMVNGDSQEEPDETFFVKLSGQTNSTLAKSQGLGTIVNDDASQSAGSLQLSDSTYSVTENGGQATIAVKRTGGSAGAVSVQYATIAGGTATDGADYTSTSGTLNWADGDTSDKTFTVAITDDSVSESNETVNISLSNPAGGALGNPSSTVLTITDNDAPPAISISDVSQAEGNSGTINFSFDVTLSAASGQTVMVDYLTADGTALVGGDYQTASGTLTFAPGETTKSFSVLVNGDAQDEPTETFVVNLSNPSNVTIVKGQGTGTIVNDDAKTGPTIEFSQAAYGVAEQLGAITVTVTRSGDTSGAASVDCATADGSAAQKSDFEYAAGTLMFNPGEVSKTFIVLLNQDSYIEGPENFNLVLSNPAGAALGAQAVAQVSITDDLPETAANPIDDAQTFVYMHYHDFLNREPDPAGLAFWTNQITSCGNDTQCIELKRIYVSAAFFLSIEFQETGYLRYLLQKESFGSTPQYAEFMRDVQEVSRGVIVNAPGWEQKLKDNQQQLAEKWVNRPDFKGLYDGLSNDDYVNALYKNAGIVTPQAEKDKLVTALNAASINRATVLLDVAADATFREQQQNAAFVMMEYFGYLRRDPNAAPDSDLSGYNFWLNKLNQFGGAYVDAEMVKAFITSTEYRQRFAQ